jgi:hypothetical protein
MVKLVYANKLAADPAIANRQVRLIELCGTKPAITCLATGVSAWKRVLSGITITGSLSERSAVQQMIVVPQPPFLNHYGLTGQVDFDPTQLFISGSNWKNAISTVQSMLIDPGQPYADCFQYVADNATPSLPVKPLLPPNRYANCVSKFAAPRVVVPSNRMRWDDILKVFIPKFQFKRASQFDFIKNGAILAPSPFPRVALNSYTITWDLRRVIASTSSRIDAYDSITERYKGPASGASGTPQQDAKLCITSSGASRSYISVPLPFSAESCYRFAGTVSADQYGLACVSSNDIILGVWTRTAVAPDDSVKPNPNSCRW